MRILPFSLLIVPLLLIVASAVAQTTTIPVRAGEHAQFTRLVIQIPEANSWRVATQGDTVRLTTEGPPLNFDLSQTFAKIPRTRLRNVIAKPEGLELQLACPCEIRASEDIPQFLVIDILGTAGVSSSQPSAMRPLQRPEHLRRAPTGANAGVNLARAMRGKFLDDMSSPTFALHHFVTASPQTKPGQPLPADPDEPSGSNIAEELARALAGSVELGLLERAHPIAPDTMPIAGLPYDDRKKLAAHLRLPAPWNAGDAAGTQIDQTAICRELARLGVGQWEKDTSIARGVQALHALYGEFDRLDPERALELTQAYLSLGFGAEARQVVALFAPSPELHQIVRGISHLLDLENMPDDISFSALQHCGTHGILWAFLGTDPRQMPARFPFDLLVREFDSLPIHLRLHLGPDILHRLVALGQTGPAAMIEAALDRVIVHHTPQLQLAKLALALEAPEPTRMTGLEQMPSAELSDDALLFMLKRRDTEDAGVEGDVIDLAKTRLLPLRGDPRGREMASLLVRAQARNANFSDAFTLAEAWESGLDPSEATLLRLEVLNRLTDAADDREFVTRVFEQLPWTIDKLPDDTSARVAARLSSLGFQHQADLMSIAAQPVWQMGSNRGLNGAEGGMGPKIRGEMVASFSGANEENDVTRARAAQVARTIQPGNQAPEERSIAESNADDNSALAQDSVQQSDDSASAPFATANDAADPVPSVEQAPRGAEILEHSRTALEHSATLRNRLQALLNGPD